MSVPQETGTAPSGLPGTSGSSPAPEQGKAYRHPHNYEVFPGQHGSALR